MGIQINGQIDRLSAVDGSFSIQDLAEVNVTGVATASNFKSGTSNVHSTGYECTNINATGIVTAASANFTGNVSVGGTLTYQDVTNIDSVGVITARAGVKVPDSQKIFLGTGDDLQIYHDGNNSFIKDAGTGRITISTNQLQLTNAADSEVMIKATQDSSVEFYYDSVKKFETHADGLHIGDGGNLDMPHDSSKIVMGASDDLQIYHDGSNSRIKNTAGSLWLQSDTGIRFTDAGVNESMAAFYDNGAVELYYDGTKKLETKSDGVDIIGELQCDTFDCDGNIDLDGGKITFDSGGNVLKWADNVAAYFGTGNDLRIYHDGNNSFIKDAGTGRLTIATSQLQLTNAADSEVMIKATQDGAVELYYDNSKKLETNSTGIHIFGNTGHADGAADLYGSGNDLSIVHDGTNSNIVNNTGDLYLQCDSDDVIIQAADDIFIKPQGGEDGIKVLGDGSVELFHNGSLRFQTNATATTMRGGGAHRCEGTFRPWANNTYDLGTSGDRWRNIYTNDLNLSNEGSANDVDGTWGNYTIQEGENDLFLINRRNGKKYKFNLTEVN